MSFCHFFLHIFTPRDDPVEDISAEFLNWKEAALVGRSVGAVLRLQADLLCVTLRGCVCATGSITEQHRLDHPSQVHPSRLLIYCI